MKRRVKKGLAVFLSVAMVLSGVSVGNLYAAEDGEGRESVIHIEDSSGKTAARETPEKETEEIKKKPAAETEEKSAAETEEDAKEETAKDIGAEEDAKENTTDSTKEAAEGTAGEDTGSETSGKTNGGNVNIEDGKDALDGEDASDEEEEPVEEELENDISGEEDGAEEEAEAGEKADAEGDNEAGERADDEGKADAEEETAPDDGKKEKDSLTAPDEENMVAELTTVAGDYRITVSAEDAIFPETARLQAEQVEDEDTVARIRETAASQNGDEEEGEETQEAEIVCFDLGIVDEEDNEADWEGDNALMTVSLERLLAPMALEEEETETEYQLYQVDKDSQEVEEKETSVNGEAVEAEMDSISRVALRAASVGDVGARAASVTTDEQLKDALNSTETSITIAGDVSLTEEVSRENGVIFTINSGSLTIAAPIIITGNKQKIQFNEGIATVTDKGRLDDAAGDIRIYNGATLIMDEGSSLKANMIDVGGTGGGTLQVNSKSGVELNCILSVAASDSVLKGGEGGSLVLVENKGVTIKNNSADTPLFIDQGQSYTTTTKTAVAASGEPVAGRLTAGKYTWNGTSFVKEGEKVDPVQSLKDQLEAAESGVISLSDNIVFNLDATMKSDKTLAIPKGKTLTITGSINTDGKKLMFQGGGEVLVDGGVDCLQGKISVIQNTTVRLQGNSTFRSRGGVAIDGGKLHMSGQSKLVSNKGGQTYTIKNSLLTAEAGAEIVLISNDKVTAPAGLFSDQGKAFDGSAQVIVGEETAAPADNQLTAGSYIWDGSRFLKKAPDPLPQTGLKNGILTLSEASANEGTTEGWAWDAEKNVLNVNYRLKGIKQIRLVKKAPASIKLNGDIIVTPDAGQEAVVAAGNFIFRADDSYTFTVNGPIKIAGKMEVINKITMNVSGTSSDALINANSDITVKGTSVLTATNKGTGSAIAGNSISVREEAKLSGIGKGSEAALKAVGEINVQNSAALTAINQGSGPAINKAPKLINYPDAKISASEAATGRPGIDYSEGNIQTYKYVKILKEVKLSDNPTVSEIEKVVDAVAEDDLDGIDAIIAQINKMSPAERASISSETIKKLDQILENATNMELIEKLSVALSGVTSNKQLKKSEIFGALVAAGLDTNDYNAKIEFIVNQVKTEEGASATFDCSLLVNGQNVDLRMPATVKIELPPEYFPLSEDQIYYAGKTITSRNAFLARSADLGRAAGGKWIDFVYNGADNSATFRIDALGTYSLFRKGVSYVGGGSSGGGRGGSGGGGGGGGGSRTPGQAAIGGGPSSGKWMKDEKGWWFLYTDQSYPKDSWCQISLAGKNEWYYFDKDGYMVTGWILSNGRWYYLSPAADGNQGKMLTGWQLIDGKWYYLNENPDGTRGARHADTWVGEYYVNGEGVWEKDKKK